MTSYFGFPIEDFGNDSYPGSSIRSRITVTIDSLTIDFGNDSVETS